MARSTLKNIAERAGLSIPTISQIMNDRKNFCSEATKQRVREIAREIGYRPNFAYKLMQGQTTKTVAILNSMPQMNSEEYVLKLIMLLISGFDKLGYSAYCNAFSQDPDENLEKIRMLINRGVENFVFLGCPFGHESIFKELKKNKLPVIGNSPVFERWVSRGVKFGIQEIFRFFESQVGGNYKLICQEKEANEGNEKIRTLMSMHGHSSINQTIEEKVFFSENIDFEVSDYAKQAYPVAYEATRRLLEQEPDTGAIMYMNDSFAIGGAEFILQPENQKYRHILLAGCNNDHAVYKFPLPISSVELRLEEIAEQLILNSLNPGECQITVKPRVYLRTACAEVKYPPWNEKIVNLT